MQTISPRPYITIGILEMSYMHRKRGMTAFIFIMDGRLASAYEGWCQSPPSPSYLPTHSVRSVS